jgi:hypothetical protein
MRRNTRVGAGRTSQQAIWAKKAHKPRVSLCRPATSIEPPSLQRVLSGTSAVTAVSKPQSNTPAPRIRTRTLFSVTIVGNTNIAFLMIHAVGGVNLRIRAASVVDCSLVAVAKTRAANETGRRQCGLAGVLAAGTHIAAVGHSTRWSTPAHFASRTKRARQRELR